MNEGPAFDADIFDELLRLVESERLPAHHVVWISQNRALKSACDQGEGSRGSRVLFENYDSFIKIIAWQFSSENPTSIFGHEGEAGIERLFDVNLKDRIVLCLNASPREHRVLAVAAIMHHQLFDSSLVSFPGLNYEKDPITEKRILDFISHRPQLAYLMPSVVSVFGLEKLTVDEFRETGNALFNKIDLASYERTFFSLVTETEMSNGSVFRITEKTMKAICLGHPTLVPPFHRG